MMKKCLLLIIFPVLFLSFTPSPLPPSVKQGKLLTTIIIDPGHGGIDPGARGTFSTEAEVALKVSMQLGKAIQDDFPNIKIIYTRTSNVLPGNKTDIKEALKYRAELANESKGDLFISIHCNSAGKKAGGWYEKRVSGYKTLVKYKGKGKKRKKMNVSVPIYTSYYQPNLAKGTETYIWAADRTDDKSEHINAEDIGESVEDMANNLDLNSPEARIRAQLYTKYYFKNSYTLASYVEEEFQKSNRASRGVKQRNNKGIWVLQATGMPSILAEIGYISNTEEERYLNSDKGQDEIVGDLLEAFKRYKKEVETSSKAR
jgi:N-acetylmuramoyl-L-alanine amidase